MAISSNSIIHHTESIDNLISIINTGGFRIQYCNEIIEITERTKIDFAIAMVCFCDIPIAAYKQYFRKEKIGETGSKSKFELGYYGDSGIGLTKDWAKSQNISPVFYIQKGTKVAKSINKLFSQLTSNKKKKFDVELKDAPYIYFCKNYEGKNPRADNPNTIYRYYNEREWRYVPSLKKEVNNELIISPKMSNEDKQAANKRLENSILPFSYNQITYIIVESEQEIQIIIETLKNKYQDVSPRELNILFTKIITTEQILNDF